MMYLLGYDIGGTKCAAILGVCDTEDGKCRIIGKHGIATADFFGYKGVMNALFSESDRLLAEYGIAPSELHAVGVSCGGPLDSKKGVVLSPPNLPDWDNVPIVADIERHYRVTARLSNDADACALAEWKFGAGFGCRNMIFLTFGTGMGAGLILNGKLYSGANNMAGEVGHIRLAEDGPAGYGKNGSFEGFCSGGGLAASALYYKERFISEHGKTPLLERNPYPTAKDLAEAARNGDAFGRFILSNCAKRLAQGLSILIDILNPEKIVIGSIYARNRDFFNEIILPIIKEETLPLSRSVCDIVPAALGEQIGDYAALGTALLSSEKSEESVNGL